jgi:DNA-3-methyladenine glycosylase
VLARDGLRARLVEVEAYDGANDPGSHAFRGRTPRNASMFRAPGHAYVYFAYGCHWMLNVSCAPEGHGAAALLRAAVPLEGLAVMRSRRPRARYDHDLLSGPAKLAQALGLDRSFDGFDLLDPASPLRLEPGEPPKRVAATVRIGLAAGKGDALPWRFVDADAGRWLSRRLD